eukprot:tig00021352_g20730.t1
MSQHDFEPDDFIDGEEDLKGSQRFSRPTSASLARPESRASRPAPQQAWNDADGVEYGRSPSRGGIRNGGGAGSRAGLYEPPRSPTSPVRDAYAGSEEPKEDMMSELEFLKRRINLLDQENVGLRTRIHRAVQESKRKDKQIMELSDPRTTVSGGGHAYGQFKSEQSLLRSVKQVAKNLKQKIEQKEEEIHRIRESPKFTHVMELELKKKTYTNEVARLQRMLSAFSGDAELAHTLSQKRLYLEEKNAELRGVYDQLKTEYQDVMEKVKSAKERLKAMSASNDR